MAGNWGACHLTGVKGKFVKCHLIPEAFQKPATSAPMLETNGKDSGIKRYTGWYDRNLVTSEGEAILAELDQEAVKFLFGKKLLYRERRSADLCSLSSDLPIGPAIKFCKFDGDLMRLKRFCLSLVWRIVNSDIDFGVDVRVPVAERTALKKFVAGESAPKAADFPCYFSVFDDGCELSKMGPAVFKLFGSKYARIFLDGVVCCVALDRRPLGFRKLGAMPIGCSDSITFFVHNSLESFAHRNQEEIMQSYVAKFGYPAIWKNFQMPIKGSI